jgi:hypothetical protein
MKAYNGSKDLKDKLVTLAKEHEANDDYVADIGAYGEIVDGVFKGSSVGCTIKDINPDHKANDHVYLAEALGVPYFITYFQDIIFEGLPDSHRYSFTPMFLDAINVGSDLSPVLPKIVKVM